MNFLQRGMLISLSTAMVAVLLLLLRASPARAVDEVEFACNGVSGTPCDVFQLDGADMTTANANTCVGTENGCNDESPVWPADWDALTSPNSFGTSGFTLDPTVGNGTGAGKFTLPWTPKHGGFSGIFSSTLVTTGTSTILKSGSKNNNDVSTWTVATQSAPPKDAFLAAALATYIGPPGPYADHELLYHGATRLSPNGSATEGIWFFGESVEICKSGTSTGSALCATGTSTLAQHQIGDLFLFITYSGNGTATIQAATWQGAAGPAGFLAPAPTTGPGSIVQCPNPGDNACAVSNAMSSIILGTPSGPQPIGTGFNVAGPGFGGFSGGSVPQLQFQEGGVDLNSILGATGPPCFSTVMFATVSSGSSPGTASLKAILLGQFNTCSISVQKACGNAVGHANDTITNEIVGYVTNTGFGSVTMTSLTDSPALDSSPTLTCYLPATAVTATDFAGIKSGCGIGTATSVPCFSTQVPAGATLCYDAFFTSNANPSTDQVTVAGTGVGTNNKSNIATCPTIKTNPNIEVSKACVPPAGGAFLVPFSGALAVEVDTLVQVCNLSSDAALTNVNVTDDRSATGGSTAVPLLTGATLGTAGSSTACKTISSTVSDYKPSDFGHCSGGSNPGTVCATSSACNGGSCVVDPGFADTVTAQGDADAFFAGATSTCEGGPNDNQLCTSNTFCSPGICVQRCTTISSTTVRCSDTASASCPLCPLAVK